LPAETSFFETPLTFGGLPPTTQSSGRSERRALYNRQANEAASAADLVFLDPDNGLERRSVRPLANKGQKYVCLEEIAPYLESGKSVLVYHHATRKNSVPAQAEAEIDRLSRLAGATQPWA